MKIEQQNRLLVLLTVIVGITLGQLAANALTKYRSRRHKLAYMVVTSTNTAADWRMIKGLILADPLEVKYSSYVTNGLPIFDPRNHLWWYPQDNRWTNEHVERGLVLVYDPTDPSNQKAYSKK